MSTAMAISISWWGTWASPTGSIAIWAAPSKPASISGRRHRRAPLRWRISTPMPRPNWWQDGDRGILLYQFDNGSFGAASQIDARIAATTALALADADEDDRIDLVAGNRGSPNRLYLNSGAGFASGHRRGDGTSA
jgi:hypothetical protein